MIRFVCFWLFYVLAFEDGEEAGGFVTLFFLLFEGRFVFGAVVLGAGAAGMEGAPLRGVGGGWYVA